MNKLVTKGPRRLVGDRWHDDNGPLPDTPLEWEPPMTDAEILEAALSDPDAQPMSDERLARMHRMPPVKRLRLKLRLSQESFAARYRIPLASLRAWERNEAEPDAVAAAYLMLIDADPDGTAATLSARTVAAE